MANRSAAQMRFETERSERRMLALIVLPCVALLAYAVSTWVSIFLAGLRNALRF